MKQLFFMFACVVMSVLAMGQDNQLVWANGRLLYGTPVAGIDSLTYDEMQDVDTLHLLLPRTLIKVVHDTVYIHDTVYVETDCGGEGDTPSAGIGVFSVSADKQVTFSKGNLQYTQSTNTWSFAGAQYEALGIDNVTGGSVGSTYGDSKKGTALADKVDLFGWSTAATNFGVSTSEDHSDYSGSFVDWGTNKIGNDAPNTWRTLTYDEWDYLRYSRTNANDLCGVAQVNGVNGLILLPDNWICPTGITFKSGFHSSIGVDYYAAYQTFTADQWSKLEESGAVFLPAAGYRFGTNVDGVQFYGGYWSDTEYDSYIARYLTFHSGGASMNGNVRDYGLSVRLVKDIEGGGTTPDTPDTPDTPTEPEEQENTENGHEYVDLGLSVKWATCNVGATKPEEYGDYFAWGETQPKDTYGWSTYKWCNGSSHTLTKYCTDNNYGTVDNKTVLDAADDAATANWGGSWRMPTDAELTELRENCTWTWISENGMGGYRVTSKKENYTDKSIFLPVTSNAAFYWSSSLGSNDPDYACDLYFDVTWVGFSSLTREYGRSVRPVCQ